MIWISCLKGSSGKETDLNRERVRDLLLDEGLMDVKV
jgi:hypothetical protein